MTLANGTADFDSIPDAIAAFANGDFIVVLDAEGRENEGDLIIAAEDLSPAKAAFLVRHTSGYLCAPLTAALATRLELPQMVAHNADPNRTAYTVSVDAATVSTGIGAHDRSATCRALANPDAKAQDLRRPGHIVPLQARDGGVRVRPGHTEAAVDFCRLAGKQPVGVIGEIVDDGDEVPGRAEQSGSFGMLRRDGCLAFGKRYGLRVVTIEALIRHLDEQGGLPQ